MTAVTPPATATLERPAGEDISLDEVVSERRRHRARRLRLLAGDRLTTEEIITASPEELIQAFDPLARSAAARWGDGSEDDLADARMGLVKAVRSYDSNKGAFAHWARLYMRQEIRRSRHRQRSHIAIPSKERHKLASLYAASERTGSPARDRTALAEHTGMPRDEIAELLAQPRATVVDDPDAARRSDGEAAATPTTAALSEDTVIADIEAGIGEPLPDELIDKIRRWLRHDGSDTGLRQIRSAVLQLQPAA